jgi:hypothetical protein
MMGECTDLIDRYIETWNETDAQRRHDLIARTWTETASYVDPMLSSDGHAEIDAMIRSVHERFPGHRIRRTGDVDSHNNRVRFGWELVPENGTALVTGTDFGIVAESGKLQAIVGFFDHVATGS